MASPSNHPRVPGRRDNKLHIDTYIINHISLIIYHIIYNILYIYISYIYSYIYIYIELYIYIYTYYCIYIYEKNVLIYIYVLLYFESSKQMCGCKQISVPISRFWQRFRTIPGCFFPPDQPQRNSRKWTAALIQHHLHRTARNSLGKIQMEVGSHELWIRLDFIVDWYCASHVLSSLSDFAISQCSTFVYTLGITQNPNSIPNNYKEANSPPPNHRP